MRESVQKTLEISNDTSRCGNMFHNRHFHSHDLNLLSYIHFCKTSSDTKKEILVIFIKMCNSVNWANLSPRQIKSSFVLN